MEYKELSKSILLFENKIPLDLVDRLLDITYIQTNTNKFSTDGNFKGTLNRFEVYDHKELFKDFNDFWFNHIESIWQNHFLKFTNLDGSEYEDLKNHNKTDWKDLFIHIYTKESVSNNPIHIDFTGLSFSCCLSDNYKGGELYFPRQNLKYKLKKQDLVIFPGGFTHPHSVEKVTDGNRITLIGQSMGTRHNHKLGQAIKFL